MSSPSLLGSSYFRAPILLPDSPAKRSEAMEQVSAPKLDPVAPEVSAADAAAVTASHEASSHMLLEVSIEELERLVAERAIVEVELLERVRGGLRARYGTIPAFVPTSLATAKRYPSESELRQLLGQSLHVVCHEVRKNPEAGPPTLIVSRRHFLEDLAFARLHVGDVLEGTVTRLTTLGAFVDIGGLEGFIPLKELDHIPVSSPTTVLSLGESVRVQVIYLDVAKRQVRLSRKALLPSPWEGIEERYPVGSRLRGIVRRVTPRAAIVQLEPGIEGIVPVEELSWGRRPPHPAYLLSAGQEAEFVVLEASSSQRRLVLSLRRTQPNPWERVHERYAIGSRVAATVQQILPTAVLVELEDGLSAIIPARELSWSHLPNPSTVVHVGQQIEAVVLQIDQAKQLLILSHRQTQPNPWEEAEKRFPVGSRLRGRIRRLLPRSAIVEVAEGVEGFIPLSELSWTRRLQHPVELLSAGQEVECTVMDVSATEQRLVLSLRQAQPNPWESLAASYPVGSEHTAVFVELQKSGALVRLSEELDAFMPRSTFAQLLRKTQQPWKAGQTLQVRIREVNPAEHSVIVEPILAPAEPTRPKPTPPKAAGHPTPARLAAPSPDASRKLAPARSDKRTGTTLADLLPEEVREKLLQTVQSR